MMHLARKTATLGALAALLILVTAGCRLGPAQTHPGPEPKNTAEADRELSQRTKREGRGAERPRGPRPRGSCRTQGATPSAQERRAQAPENGATTTERPAQAPENGATTTERPAQAPRERRHNTQRDRPRRRENGATTTERPRPRRRRTAATTTERYGPGARRTAPQPQRDRPRGRRTAPQPRREPTQMPQNGIATTEPQPSRGDANSCPG